MAITTITTPAAGGAGSAPLLRARDLAKAYGTTVVVDGLAFDAAPGQRIGLVGENGAGKSTLLRLLAELEEPDAGTVTRPADTGFLHQELPHSDATQLAEVVAEALSSAREVEQRLAVLAEQVRLHPADQSVLADYAATLELAEVGEVWDAERRCELVLAGLGLADIAGQRRLGQLSGGQRSRLGLAALLIRQPRALLLDEPTNHLDDAAVEFLQRHLQALPGAVVLASHDRVFLDEVCSGLLDLDPSRDGPRYYGGTYTEYRRERRLERQQWVEQHRGEQEQLRQLRHAVRHTARDVAKGHPPRDGDKMGHERLRGRVQKQVSRRIRNAQRRLEELERDQVRKPPEPLRFQAHLTGGSDRDGPVLLARQVEVPGRVFLDQLDLAAGERLLVTGANGAGKSSLLYVLAGWLDPGPRARVQHLGGARVGLLEQDVWFDHPELSPRQYYTRVVSERSGALPRLIDLGLLAPRDLDRPVGVLSVGQRRRLALALLVADPPAVLLLDEPTNHISLRLAEELEQALQSAPGAVVVASHDRWLRQRWEGAELGLSGGQRSFAATRIPLSGHGKEIS